MSIGIVMTISSIFFFLVYFLNHNSNIFLNLFRLLIVLVLLVTLALGAYIWFQSLNIQSDYSLRWLEWDNKLKKVFQDTVSSLLLLLLFEIWMLIQNFRISVAVIKVLMTMLYSKVTAPTSLLKIRE